MGRKNGGNTGGPLPRSSAVDGDGLCSGGGAVRKKKGGPKEGNMVLSLSSL